jgi:hypothetical protein
MKKVALIIPPQSFNFNEVKLSKIKKKIKIKISASFKKIYKKQFYWNYIFLKKNFNKYKFNIAILMLFISTYSRSHNSSFAKLMQSWPIIFIYHRALILNLWPSRVICVNDLIFFRGLGKLVE